MLPALPILVLVLARLGPVARVPTDADAAWDPTTRSWSWLADPGGIEAETGEVLEPRAEGEPEALLTTT